MKSSSNMKKGAFALVLALVIALPAMALTGCSGSSSSSSSASSSSTKASTSTSATASASSSAATSSASSSTSSVSLKDLESAMTEAYMGVTDANEGFYYASSANGELCIVMAADTNGNTVSFVGPATVNGTMVTVSDISNGLSLTFDVQPQSDGTIVLDMGDTGKATVAPCSVSDVLTVMDALDKYGNAVA